jgi:hypothetical protein
LNLPEGLSHIAIFSQAGELFPLRANGTFLSRAPLLVYRLPGIPRQVHLLDAGPDAAFEVMGESHLTVGCGGTDLNSPGLPLSKA